MMYQPHEYNMSKLLYLLLLLGCLITCAIPVRCARFPITRAPAKPGEHCCPVDTTRLWNKALHGLNPTATEQLQHLFAYQFLLPQLHLRDGLSYLGSAVRLRKFVSDLLAGTRPLKVGVVGGSISWGQGASDRGKTDWFSVFVKWLESVSKQKVYGKNGCVPATPASYMVVCLELYVEPDVDLVFIEYVFNDELDNKVIDNHVVIAMEQLVRKLMALPGQPAVVLVQVPHVWKTELLPFHQTSEDLEGALAAYYGLSTVSLRNSLFPLNVVQPTSGYLFNETYPEHHPGDSGHKMIADLAVHLIQETALGLMTNPVQQAEEAAWGRPLADPPMYLGNFPPETSSCIAGERFRSQVLSHKGWEWVNEGTEEKPKWGYVTTTSGSSLLVRVNTTQGSTLDAATLAKATMPMIVQFLRSYSQDMGYAVVQCIEGCSCKDHPISGWHTWPSSETGMTGMAVRLTPGFTSCDLLFNVTDKRRTDGGHKFKLIGVVTTAVGYDFSAAFPLSRWRIPDK